MPLNLNRRARARAGRAFDQFGPFQTSTKELLCGLVNPQMATWRDSKPFRAGPPKLLQVVRVVLKMTKITKLTDHPLPELLEHPKGGGELRGAHQQCR